MLAVGCCINQPALFYGEVQHALELSHRRYMSLIQARAATLPPTGTAAAARTAPPSTSRCAARPRPDNTRHAPASFAAGQTQLASAPRRPGWGPSRRCLRTRCCRRAAGAQAGRCRGNPASSTCKRSKCVRVHRIKHSRAHVQARTKSCCSCRRHCATPQGAWLQRNR